MSNRIYRGSKSLLPRTTGRWCVGQGVKNITIQADFVDFKTHAFVECIDDGGGGQIKNSPDISTVAQSHAAAGICSFGFFAG
jgi:hypothetical protein